MHIVHNFIQSGLFLSDKLSNSNLQVFRLNDRFVLHYTSIEKLKEENKNENKNNKEQHSKLNVITSLISLFPKAIVEDKYFNGDIE